MLIYVFIKMCDGTLNGNQTMGILLLFGIMCLFASVVPWLLPPNEMVRAKYSHCFTTLKNLSPIFLVTSIIICCKLSLPIVTPPIIIT
jgi:hypothetical protein